MLRDGLVQAVLDGGRWPRPEVLAELEAGWRDRASLTALPPDRVTPSDLDAVLESGLESGLRHADLVVDELERLTRLRLPAFTIEDYEDGRTALIANPAGRMATSAGDDLPPQFRAHVAARRREAILADVTWRPTVQGGWDLTRLARVHAIARSTLYVWMRSENRPKDRPVDRRLSDAA